MLFRSENVFVRGEHSVLSKVRADKNVKQFDLNDDFEMERNLVFCLFDKATQINSSAPCTVHVLNKIKVANHPEACVKCQTQNMDDVLYVATANYD